MIWTHLVSLLFVGLASTLCVVAPATPPVSELAEEVNHFLAFQHPNVADKSQLKHIGPDVPENLHRLITGASPRGRLTLPSPSPGNALLLTQNDGPGIVRHVGIVNDASGVHYFRTLPVELKGIPADRSQIPIDPSIHAFPQSTEVQPLRKVAIDLGQGKLYKPSGEFSLNHVAVLPTYVRRETGVYHRYVLEKVLGGESHTLIDWSRTPNWSSRDELKKNMDPKTWKQGLINKYNGAKELSKYMGTVMQDSWRDRRYKNVQDVSNALRQKWNQRTYRGPKDVYNAVGDRFRKPAQDEEGDVSQEAIGESLPGRSRGPKGIYNAVRERLRGPKNAAEVARTRSRPGSTEYDF